MIAGATAALVVVSLLAAGCQPASRPVPSAAPQPLPVALTAADPQAEIAFEPVPDAKVIRLTVVSIANPAGQAIAFAVSIANAEQSPAAVGTTSPFPPDHAGDLTIAASEVARRVASGASPRLVVRLTTVSGDQVRPDVRVELTAKVS